MSDSSQQQADDEQQALMRGLFGEHDAQPSSPPDDAQRIARAFLFPNQQKIDDEGA